ncbi:MAG: rhamnan synthesis F family protein, partial [Pseudomonadota bacterium]|nr:rhamnan synthesis F family protein [Pseudomonadota bacterium]
TCFNRDILLMKRLAVFAAHDPDGIIDDYILYYLTELAKVADVVFVCDHVLVEAELNKVKTLCKYVIAKRHLEYDFGSYKLGYFWAKNNDILQDYDELIFCNDSAYGPFCSFDEIFKQMENKPNNEFWSVFNERNKRVSYCQSYFLVFKKNVFLSECFLNFVKSIKKEASHTAVVRNYEQGLTKVLVESNFNYNSYFSSNRNDPHNDKFYNLIISGFPFLKRTCFSHFGVNSKCRNICNYKDGISSVSDYPVDLIEINLKRRMGKYFAWSVFDKSKTIINYKLFAKIVLLMRPKKYYGREGRGSFVGTYWLYTVSTKYLKFKSCITSFFKKLISPTS